MILIYVFCIIWLIRIITNSLSYIHLWYVKEYRFDRMRIHLQTPAGIRLLFLPFKVPPKSPKSIVIFGCTLLCIVWALYILPFHPLVRLFVIDVLLFPYISFCVLILKIPTVVYHKYVIWKAVRDFRSHKKMTVIGITGSYGKTSTKDMLYTILCTRYNTLKTEASKNSPIGIAEIILSKLSQNHEIFIVEMGAYKKGEIAEMCRMVKPDIGILTAVNAQHQDLFGSIQTTIEAKYELIKNLSSKRIAICNADNEYTYAMSRRAAADGCDVVLYTTQNKKISDATLVCKASDITLSPKGIIFTLTLGKHTGTCTTSLLGIHHVSNILAAASAAHVAGLDFNNIIKGCNMIKPSPKTMFPVNGIYGASFIDDSFNNNPDAASAALEYMKVYKGRKIFVMQPMIELGQYAKESHVYIGRLASQICDIVILTNTLEYESFASGFHTDGSGKQLHVLSPKNAADFLKKTCKKNDLVLFKGKEAGLVLSYLQKHNEHIA